MKLEEQVVSLELAKELKGLGVKQESVFHWYDYRGGLFVEQHGRQYGGYSVGAAFTVAELGEMLPMDYWLDSRKSVCRSFRYDRVWVCGDTQAIGGVSGKTEADARAKMLIHLIEQGLVAPSPQGQDGGR